MLLPMVKAYEWDTIPTAPPGIDAWPVMYSVDASYNVTDVPSLITYLRTPNPSEVHDLAVAHTGFTSAGSGLSCPYNNLSGLQGSYTWAAAWMSISADATTKRTSDDSDVAISAEFKAKMLFRLFPCWWVSKSNTTWWHWYEKDWEHRNDPPESGGNDIEDLTNYTLRIYYIKQSSISLYTNLNYVGTLNGVQWTSATYAHADVADNTQTITGTNTYQSGWVPSYTEEQLNNMPSSAFQYVDVTCYRDEASPNCWRFKPHAYVTFAGRIQHAKATAHNTSTVLGALNEYDGLYCVTGDPGGVIIAPPARAIYDGASASAYAKERIQIVAMMPIAQNSKVVRGKVLLSDSTPVQNVGDVTFTLKQAGTPVWAETFAVESDVDFDMATGLPNGTYTLEASAEGYVLPEPVTVVVNNDEVVSAGTLTLIPTDPEAFFRVLDLFF
jgi:hypothetical protein